MVKLGEFDGPFSKKQLTKKGGEDTDDELMSEIDYEIYQKILKLNYLHRDPYVLKFIEKRGD